MIRIILWSVLLVSGLVVLIFLGSIITTMVQTTDSSLEIQPRFDSFDVASSTTQESQVDEEVQELIKKIYNRKGYSNPKPTSDDEEDAPDVVVRKRKRTRRPLRIIDKDFNPYQSYTIKHPNGTLTYVFPSPQNSSHITSTSNPIKSANETSTSTTIVDRGSSNNPADPSNVDSSHYPIQLVNDIMNEHKANFEGAFGNDMVVSTGDELQSRFETSNDEFLCDSEESLLHPREGTTWNNSNVRIVNTDNYKQGVRIEMCRNEGQPCRFCDEDTVCKQVYHYRTLVAVDLETQKPYKERIRLASCCKCAKRSS